MIVERDDEVGGAVEDAEYGAVRLVWYVGIVAACAEFRNDGEMEQAVFVFREEVWAFFRVDVAVDWQKEGSQGDVGPSDCERGRREVEDAGLGD